MSKHTPGEWFYAGLLTASENHKGWRVYHENRWIADVSPMNDAKGDPTQEAIGNVALICAAPDLYKACKNAVVWLALAAGRDPATAHPKAIKNAQADLDALTAALLKAEGKESA